MNISLPKEQFPLASASDLPLLADVILRRLTITSALFQLFGFLGDVLRFSEGAVDYFCELPVANILERPKFTVDQEIMIITLEFGFHRYGDVDGLHFISPTDEPGRREDTAFLHPVLRHYSNGKLVAEVHIDETLETRYDKPTDEEIDTEKGSQRYQYRQNMVVNALNQIVQLTPKTYPEGHYDALMPWPTEQDTASHVRQWRRPKPLSLMADEQTKI